MLIRGPPVAGRRPVRRDQQPGVFEHVDGVGDVRGLPGPRRRRSPPRVPLPSATAASTESYGPASRRSGSSASRYRPSRNSGVSGFSIGPDDPRVEVVRDRTGASLRAELPPVRGRPAHDRVHACTARLRVADAPGARPRAGSRAAGIDRLEPRAAAQRRAARQQLAHDGRAPSRTAAAGSASLTGHGRTAAVPAG